MDLCCTLFLEPPAGNNIHKPGSQHLPNTQLDTATQYPTIIALLRSELEKERASHAHTHDTAELEILTLRAQLARREAELEGCLVHSETEHRGFVLKAAESGSEPLKHKKASLRSKTVTEVQPQQKPASSFTPEEASQLLGLRAEKNRRLEAEIKQIASRVCRSSFLTLFIYSLFCSSSSKPGQRTQLRKYRLKQSLLSQ